MMVEQARSLIKTASVKRIGEAQADHIQVVAQLMAECAEQSAV